jgi:hypothetical protein
MYPYKNRLSCIVLPDPFISLFIRPTFSFYLFKIKTNLPHSHLIIEIGGHKGIFFF